MSDVSQCAKDLHWFAKLQMSSGNSWDIDMLELAIEAPPNEKSFLVFFALVDMTKRGREIDWKKISKIVTPNELSMIRKALKPFRPKLKVL